MNWALNWELFATTYALVFLAELPDKTSFATLVLATDKNPKGVFAGVAAAFFIQTLVAVTLGSVFGLLPPLLVKSVAIALFFFFAARMAFHSPAQEQESATKPGSKRKGASFWKSATAAFGVIFIAEWGDLTQMTTAALQAKYQSPVTVFAAACLALWSVSVLAVVVGNRLSRLIRPEILRRIASTAFGLVGLLLLIELLATTGAIGAR